MKSTLASLVLTALLCGCATQDHPPIIAGQSVPNQNVILDFTKRYDVICRDGQESKTYTNCRILGYTGELVQDASGSAVKSYFPQFGRWLVLELLGGRRVFLPPGSIAFLEETRVK